MAQDKKTILRIKIAHDKFTRKLDGLRIRERNIVKEYNEKDSQQKILNIKKEIEE
jgi:hypothetical protein